MKEDLYLQWEKVKPQFSKAGIFLSPGQDDRGGAELGLYEVSG